MKDLSIEFIARGSYIQLIPAKAFNPDPKTPAGPQDENRKEWKLDGSLLPEGIDSKSFKRITLARIPMKIDHIGAIYKTGSRNRVSRGPFLIGSSAQWRVGRNGDGKEVGRRGEGRKFVVRGRGARRK
jgi:hypothetical protein